MTETQRMELWDAGYEAASKAGRPEIAPLWPEARERDSRLSWVSRDEGSRVFGEALRVFESGAVAFRVS